MSDLVVFCYVAIIILLTFSTIFFYWKGKKKELVAISNKNLIKSFHNFQDCIYYTNFHGKFIYCNVYTEELTGYTEDEMKQMHFTELIREDFREDIAKFYENNLLKKRISSYVEFPVVRKDGSEVWVGQKVSVVPNDSNPSRVEKLIAVVRDIDNIKQKENEILALNKELSILKKINHEVLRSNSENEIITATLTYLAEVIDGCSFSIHFFLNEKQQVVIHEYDSANREVKIPVTTAFEEHDEYLDLKAGHPVYISDFTLKAKLSKVEEERYKKGYKSSYTAPLMADGQLFGALNISSQSDNFLREDQKRLINDVSNSFTLGLYNMRMRAGYNKK